MNSELKRLLIQLIISLYLVLTYMTFFLSDEKVRALTDEDGIFETMGALFFLLCSILFALTILYNYQKNNTFRQIFKKNIFHLLLGFVFFIGFMEEISWGQRILNLQTPKNLAEFNIQKEMNIHNLKWFHGNDDSGEEKNFWQKLINIDRLFTLFWLSFCLIIPLLYRHNSTVEDFLNKINLPIVPIFLGSLFLCNYIGSKFIEYYVGALAHSATEIKETNIAILFVCVALFEVHKIRASKKAESFGN